MIFQKIQSEADIELLAATANEIWHEYFPCILTKEQIDYMVAKFQSKQPMTEQIADGYLYYLVKLNDTIIGYIGLHPEEKKLFLSKLYLKNEARNHGYASQMLEFIEQVARDLGLSSIYLTVNKYNEHSIAVYKKKGFLTIKDQVADIGNGFVMDDYIMEKTIA
ncbi:Acetyltransferase (GNAT) family protein [Clostridiales bacterium CHKCI001]|nr:Acetyltransferase (GNAT) family protein [Clostridiales bacterium CHKCI001]